MQNLARIARENARSEQDADAAHMGSTTTSTPASIIPLAFLGDEQARIRKIAPVPRITIQAFCDSAEAVEIIGYAAQDRLMARAHVSVQTGGVTAAANTYQDGSTPNLIIIESQVSAVVLLSELDRLAQVCNPGTKVIVAGSVNDITLYRELKKRGVSEYLVAPLDPSAVIATISGTYMDEASGRLGQVCAFVGAKGGVGSSTIAHNAGWAIGHHFGSDVILADMDLPFGTGSLNFNLDPAQGITEAVQDAGRLDTTLLDRLLTKYDDHLSLLAAPATLDRAYDLDPGAFEHLLEVAQVSVPFMVLDVPHIWTEWAMRALALADQVVITAVPDLANLRNAKNLVNFLRQARPNDPPPKVVLNQVGMSKRPEIKPHDFAKALGIDPIACIPFEPHLFGLAANNGQMIAQVSRRANVSQKLVEVAQVISGRKEQKSRRHSFAFDHWFRRRGERRQSASRA